MGAYGGLRHQVPQSWRYPSDVGAYGGLRLNTEPYLHFLFVFITFVRVMGAAFTKQYIYVTMF